MPAPTRSLTLADVHDHVRRHCLSPGDPPEQVGIELELLSMAAADPSRRPPLGDLLGAVGGPPLPRGGRLTLEPGGQIELSSLVQPGAAAAIEATRTDLRALRARLGRAGIEAAALGLDPCRPCRRIVSGPRYDAMETYFGSDGSDGSDRGAGLRMMCSTASVQVNLDLGDANGLTRRWRQAHAIGPVLVAAFANSPMGAGRITGAKSTRQQIWAALDPTRSGPALSSSSPADAWASYALAARVMLIRNADGRRFEPVRAGLPFARWMVEGHELGHPRIDDFAYHLTTLFPPVRPKGWLELRMIDAVPDPWWEVAVAVTTALLDDAEAFDVAERACRPVAHCWAEAAADGLGRPGILAAARTCFAAAITALPRLGLDRDSIVAAEAFVDRYVDRGRCPGDDLLDAWRLVPVP